MAVTSTLGVSSRAGVAFPTARRAVVPACTTASRLRTAPIVAFLGSKSSNQKQASKTTSSSNTTARGKTAGKTTFSSKAGGKKQNVVPKLGAPPTNAKENAESVLWFVAVAGFFLTGVLFVTIPAFQVGGNAFTQTWMKGMNKTVGIKPPGNAGPGYAPGPGPAAAPGSPATTMSANQQME